MDKVFRIGRSHLYIDRTEVISILKGELVERTNRQSNFNSICKEPKENGLGFELVWWEEDYYGHNIDKHVITDDHELIALFDAICLIERYL